jgi:integrase
MTQSPLAVSIIKEALSLSASGGGSDYVFQSPRHGQPITAHALAVAMARVAKRLRSSEAEGDKAAETAAMDAWRTSPPAPHDLRRTAATRMRALGIVSDDVKRVLNHAPTSVLGRHYDHYDALPEKRWAVETWARELKRIIGADASD